MKPNRCSTNRAERAAIYIQAAKKIAMDHYGLAVLLPKYKEEHLNIREKFLGGTFNVMWELGLEEGQDVRVLILCFMAAMVEAGDA